MRDSSESKVEPWETRYPGRVLYDKELKSLLARSSHAGSVSFVYMKGAVGTELQQYRAGMTLREAFLNCGGFGKEEIIELTIVRLYAQGHSVILLPMYVGDPESFRPVEGDIVIPSNREMHLPDRTYYDRKLRDLLSRRNRPDQGSFIYVMGSAVNTEQILPFEPGITLGDVIARCGGPGHAFGIIILRRHEKRDGRILFRFRTDHWNMYPLKENDIVSVDKESI